MLIVALVDVDVVVKHVLRRGVERMNTLTPNNTNTPIESQMRMGAVRLD